MPGDASRRACMSDLTEALALDLERVVIEEVRALIEAAPRETARSLGLAFERPPTPALCRAEALASKRRGR